MSDTEKIVTFFRVFFSFFVYFFFVVVLFFFVCIFLQDWLPIPVKFFFGKCFALSFDRGLGGETVVIPIRGRRGCSVFQVQNFHLACEPQVLGVHYLAQ